jgi:hypothetical protein
VLDESQKTCALLAGPDGSWHNTAAATSATLIIGEQMS